VPGRQAAGQQCLYIADTGNNDRARDVLTIFVVDEPMISAARNRGHSPLVGRAPGRFAIRYPGPPEDAEAIAIAPDGDVTIVTKGRTPTISFFGFSKADIAKALTSTSVDGHAARRHAASRRIRGSGDG
jgi:hypothetical protein